MQVTLKAAISGKQGNSTNLVCSWPFVNALRCWGRVIAHYPVCPRRPVSPTLIGNHCAAICVCVF